MSQLVKKISTKTVMGTVPTPEVGKTVQLFRVVGVARKMRYVETNLGQSVGFRGDWRAVRFSDHEQFEANEAFFPVVIQGLLEAAMQEMEADGEIKCAFDIGVRGVAKKTPASCPYEYSITPLVKPQQTSTMTELLEQTNKQRALPTPTAERPTPKK